MIHLSSIDEQIGILFPKLFNYDKYKQEKNLFRRELRIQTGRADIQKGESCEVRKCTTYSDEQCIL